MITLYQIDTKTAKEYQEQTNKPLYRFDLTVKDLTKDIYKLYKPVAQFATNDKDEAFEADNIGDNSKILACKAHHSMSVGDILKSDKEWFMVSAIGFEKIDGYYLECEEA
jgi:hypothetical protein